MLDQLTGGHVEFTYLVVSKTLGCARVWDPTTDLLSKGDTDLFMKMNSLTGLQENSSTLVTEFSKSFNDSN